MRSRAFIFTGRSWASIRRSASWPRRVARNTCASIIKKHELTRPDKEDDRVRHIEALECANRPGFFDLPRQCRTLTNLSRRKLPKSRTWISPPRTACGTRPGRFPSADEIKFIETQFAQIPFLYIADGHHRSAAAARVFQVAPGRGPQRTISRRDFSAQPDADPALQPRAEGFERLDAGAIVGNARRRFRH